VDNPRDTVILLDTLTDRGFGDAAFSRLHHRRCKGEEESISSHRSYCLALAEKGGRFTSETNKLVQQRLKLVLENHKRDPSQDFVSLAEAAWAAIPHPPGARPLSAFRH
jgi:hypothetical protein